ncbi:hypothetical protein D030_2007 [Vibrio parahaemolyticus AQ3810]|nr:hypothetical protein VPUCM_21445 [Vibrio parahaemolyticus UCM-V493]EXF70542.1 hypothetical protein D030_2007 [Vibrio parahaemolyticus AQ3810]
MNNVTYVLCKLHFPHWRLIKKGLTHNANPFLFSIKSPFLY